MTQIEELLTKAEFRDAYPIMRELHTHLDELTFTDLLSEMIADGYQLFALRDDDGEMAAVAGVIVNTSFQNGRNLYIQDLVTASHARSSGYGLQLITFVETYARDEGCGVVWLDSSLHREDAHRFYGEKAGYTQAGLVFRKVLD